MNTLDRLIRYSPHLPSKSAVSQPRLVSEILTFEAELDIVERFLQIQDARRMHPSASAERESALVG